MPLNRKVLIACNAFLLFSSFIFLSITLLWIAQKETVVLAGKQWAIAYIHPYLSKKIDAVEKLKKGELEPSIELVNEWENYYLKDRVYAPKRDLFEKLVEELYGQEKYEEVHEWSKIWMAMNERDITARAFWYDSLTRIPERAKEGEKGLAINWQHFPNNKTLAKFYAKVAKKQGNTELYFRIAKPFENTNPEIVSQQWSAYWDKGKNSTAESLIKTFDLIYDGNNQWHINLTIPKQARRLRLYPRKNIRVRMRHFHLEVGEKTHTIPHSALKTRKVKRQGEWVKTNSHDAPQIGIRVRKYLKNIKEENIDVVLRFEMKLEKLLN